MKRTLLLSLIAAFLVAIAALGQTALATEDYHRENSTALQKLQLNAGKKWATDAVLGQSLNGIRHAMAMALPMIHKDRFSDSDYVVHASNINQKVGYAIERCKLDAKADAKLYLVTAQLMAGA